MKDNMEDEKYTENSPVLSIFQTESILNQMKRSVCQIEIGSSKGTGFFCKISTYNNESKKVLMIAFHTLNPESSNNLKIYMNNGEEFTTIKLDNSRIIYKIKEQDLIIIEITSDDKIKCDYLELDYDYNEQNINDLNKKLIYILQYPNGKGCQASFGQLYTILNPRQFNIKHNCSTEYGSSGSPIILLENSKVIGFHLQRHSIYNINGGNFIFYAINFFKNIHQQNIKHFPEDFILIENNNNTERKTYNVNSSFIFNNLNFTKNKSEKKLFAVVII